MCLKTRVDDFSAAAMSSILLFEAKIVGVQDKSVGLRLLALNPHEIRIVGSGGTKERKSRKALSVLHQGLNRFGNARTRSIPMEKEDCPAIIKRIEAQIKCQSPNRKRELKNAILFFHGA